MAEWGIYASVDVWGVRGGGGVGSGCLAQACSNSIANTLELLQSCIKPLIWFHCNKVSNQDPIPVKVTPGYFPNPHWYGLFNGCWWGSCTGVKQCIFHWLISSELVQKQKVFNSVKIHNLIITCIICENIFVISVPKCINIAPFWTWITCVTVSDGICNTDYTGLKWSNINQFW